MTPTQDITLGCYYLTAEPRQQRRDRPAHLCCLGPRTKSSSPTATARCARTTACVSRIPDFGKKTVYGDSERKVIETTVGRVIFSEIWPDELGFLQQSRRQGAAR